MVCERFHRRLFAGSCSAQAAPCAGVARLSLFVVYGGALESLSGRRRLQRQAAHRVCPTPRRTAGSRGSKVQLACRPVFSKVHAADIVRTQTTARAALDEDASRARDPWKASYYRRASSIWERQGRRETWPQQVRTLPNHTGASGSVAVGT